MEIVLASASPRRAALLAEWGIPFRVLPAEDVDESAARGEAAAVATRLAREKAEAVARTLDSGRGDSRECLVIGADTVVELDGAVLGKPSGPDEARAMLLRLSGRAHRVVSGVAVCRLGRAPQVERETSEVAFRALSEEEVDWYVKSGDWKGKAGAYGIQSQGRSLVAGFRGCYQNIVGLPMRRLLAMLAAQGAQGAFLHASCDCAARPLWRGWLSPDSPGCEGPGPEDPAS